MKSSARPSEKTFFGVCCFSAVGILLWLLVLKIGSAFVGWGDGATVVRESHFLRDRIPIFSLFALALGFLPVFGLRTALVCLGVAFGSYVYFAIGVLWRDVGLIGLFWGVVILAPFLLLRLSVEVKKTE